MNDRLNLEPLFDEVDIVELAKQLGAGLKKSGKAWQSKCPFHHGDNPTAFTVWPDSKTWKCFTGCNDGGDALALVMKAKGYEFIEAVKWLAEWARVPLDKLNWSPEAVKEQEKQIARSEVLTRAANFYAAKMWSVDEHGQANAAARWATGRGLSELQIKAARWGYSKADDALLKAITRDAPEMIPPAREMGLIRADGKDFCANAGGDEVSPEGWIIYPHAKSGKVLYLSARAMNQETKDKSRNLPGSRQIYRADVDLNLSLAPEGREIWRLREDGLVLVEGPADAESCRAWGWPAWAMCGAPITEEDNPQLIADLRKKSQHATLYAAMSNDAPGRKFAEKICETLGPLTRIVLWPKRNADDKKSDANACLQRGFDDTQVTELFDVSETYLDLQIDAIGRMRDVRRKADGIERLAALVAQLSETERKVYIGKVADADLDISRREFEKMVAARIKSQGQSAIEVIGGQLSYYGEALINCSVRVERELIKDDGQHPPTIEYHITGKLQNGKALPAIDVPAEEFDGMKWIGRLWGARAYTFVGGGKVHLLKRAILETSLPEMKTDRVHTFTGFYQVNGARAFLSATGALTATGLDETARVELSNNMVHYALPKPVTGEDLLAAYRTSLAFLDIAPATITVPLWAVMYQAVLSEIKSLNAVIQVYGPTQSKKSTISHLALTHYGAGFVKGRDYKAPMDWTSTAADIEGYLFTCKDVVTIIDDYAPQFTSAQESRDIAKRAHYVIRSVGNRSSRGRRNADMTSRARFTPRGNVIMTAEQPLIGQSIVGRTVVVPIEYGSIDLAKLSAAQDVHELYSVALAGYVQWAICNWDRIKEQSNQLVNAWLSDMNGAFPNQDRLSDYFAAMRLGLHWGLRYGEEIGAIDGAEQHEAAMAVDLLTLLEEQSTRISDQSPVLKFFTAIEEMLGSEKLALLLRTVTNIAGDEGSPEVPYQAELIGWKVPEQRQVWMLMAPALTAVKEYWAGIDERFDTLLDALRREIWQHGYIDERDDRQLEPSKWINKKYGTRRVLVLNVDKVKEKLGVDLLNENTEIF